MKKPNALKYWFFVWIGLSLWAFLFFALFLKHTQAFQIPFDSTIGSFGIDSSDTGYYLFSQPLGSGYTGTATSIELQGYCNTEVSGNLIGLFLLRGFATEEGFLDWIEEGSYSGLSQSWEVDSGGFGTFSCDPSGIKVFGPATSGETIFSYSWNGDWFYVVELFFANFTGQDVTLSALGSSIQWNGFDCNNFSGDRSGEWVVPCLSSFSLGMDIQGVTSTFIPPPPDVSSSITSIVQPLSGSVSTSTTVLFEFNYFNGIPLVQNAFAEVRDVDANIQYATALIPPNASGGNTYLSSLVLEQGNMHMWRPVLDLGTSTQPIYGNWVSFDVVEPSAPFSIPPVEYWNFPDWENYGIGTSTVSDLEANASSSCSGASNALIEGGCRLVVFLFTPGPFVREQLMQLGLDIYNSFPFNLAFLTTAVVGDIFLVDWQGYVAPTTTVMVLDLENASSSNPFIQHNFGPITLLSSDTIKGLIPYEVAQDVRIILETGLYLMFVTLLTFAVRQLFKG